MALKKIITLDNLQTFKENFESKLGSASSKNVGTGSGNVPVLDANGKLDTAVLPAIAVSETFTASSQSAMLALTAQVGDVCVRTDETKTYILVNTPASTLENWKLLEHPADAVSSVNGKTGMVSLTTNDLTNDSGFITSSYHDSSKQDTLVSGTNIKTVNSQSILGSGNITINDNNYYPTAISWSNGTSNGPTGTITMSGTSNISIPAIPSASASYSGIVTTGGQTFAGNKGFNGSVVLNNGGTFYKPIYLGTSIPSKGDGSTVYFGEDLIMNRRTGAVSGFYAESSQWNRFLGLHMNPAYICTCNYKGDGSATVATSTDGLWKASQTTNNTEWSGYLGYLFNSNFTNGATFPVANLSTNPIVITVKSATGTKIDATDTDYIELNGWRYEGYQGTSNYYGKLTAYKLEILTDYENDTWVKVFERTNVEDHVYALKFPVWSSVGGSASYTNFYGIRLTISGAVAGSSGYLGLTELKLMETRPAGAPSDGVGAISQLGGNLYGNITLPSKSGAGKYTEIKISPSDSDNYNQLGESSKQWYRIYAKNLYRNGTEINSLYVPQTRTVNGKALSSDISLTHADIAAGNLTLGDGANTFYYRTQSPYKAGFYFQTNGDESLVFANQYQWAGWMFVNNVNPDDRTSWQSLTPILQIKNGGVAINKLIGQQVTPSYALDVNGTANATTLYENGVRVATTSDIPSSTKGITYLTTAPSSANTDGGLIIVVLSSEPATKYAGYIYLITE